MTSFVTWVGVDSRGPASLYFASDSRISWSTSTNDKWDYGRKVFAASNSPDLLGYVGYAFFPSLILGQIVSAIDTGVLYSNTESPEIRCNRIFETIKVSFGHLPQISKQSFTLFYATRENEGMKANFLLWVLSRTDDDRWFEESILVPRVSSTIKISGSGVDALTKWQSYWDSSSQGGTSRAVFSALCDSINSDIDPYSGGAPQLVGIFRKAEAQTMGVVIDQTPYLFGLPMPAEQSESSNIQWRNSLFERVKANGNLVEGAKKHHAPHGLAKGMHKLRFQ